MLSLFLATAFAGPLTDFMHSVPSDGCVEGTTNFIAYTCSTMIGEAPVEIVYHNDYFGYPVGVTILGDLSGREAQSLLTELNSAWGLPLVDNPQPSFVSKKIWQDDHVFAHWRRTLLNGRTLVLVVER